MIATPLTIGGRAPVLGSFGKGAPGSVALNFAPSGGSNCDAGCPYHPESTAANAAPGGARCYAARTETRPDRRQLADKLSRHEAAGADAVLEAAAAELAARGWRLPWFRISAFGSVPATPPRGLRAMLERLAEAGTPVHLPVETARKAARYRAALGDVVAVRESVATPRRWRTASGPVSTVAGSMATPPRERLEAAREAAADRRRRTGRRVVVCPAVAAGTLRRGAANRAKCGSCTACADPYVDVVYPAHA